MASVHKTPVITGANADNRVGRKNTHREPVDSSKNVYELVPYYQRGGNQSADTDYNKFLDVIEDYNNYSSKMDRTIQDLLDNTDNRLKKAISSSIELLRMHELVISYTYDYSNAKFDANQVSRDIKNHMKDIIEEAAALREAIRRGNAAVLDEDDIVTISAETDIDLDKTQILESMESFTNSVSEHVGDNKIRMLIGMIKKHGAANASAVAESALQHIKIGNTTGSVPDVSELHKKMDKIYDKIKKKDKELEVAEGTFTTRLQDVVRLFNYMGSIVTDNMQTMNETLAGTTNAMAIRNIKSSKIDDVRTYARIGETHYQNLSNIIESIITGYDDGPAVKLYYLYQLSESKFDKIKKDVAGKLADAKTTVNSTKDINAKRRALGKLYQSTMYSLGTINMAVKKASAANRVIDISPVPDELQQLRKDIENIAHNISDALAIIETVLDQAKLKVDGFTIPYANQIEKKVDDILKTVANKIKDVTDDIQFTMAAGADTKKVRTRIYKEASNVKQWVDIIKERPNAITDYYQSNRLYDRINFDYSIVLLTIEPKIVRNGIVLPMSIFVSRLPEMDPIKTKYSSDWSKHYLYNNRGFLMGLNNIMREPMKYLGKWDGKEYNKTDQVLNNNYDSVHKLSPDQGNFINADKHILSSIYTQIVFEVFQSLMSSVQQAGKEVKKSEWMKWFMHNFLYVPVVGDMIHSVLYRIKNDLKVIQYYLLEGGERNASADVVLNMNIPFNANRVTDANVDPLAIYMDGTEAKIKEFGKATHATAQMTNKSGGNLAQATWGPQMETTTYTDAQVMSAIKIINADTKANSNINGNQKWNQSVFTTPLNTPVVNVGANTPYKYDVISNLITLEKTVELSKKIYNKGKEIRDMLIDQVVYENAAVMDGAVGSTGYVKRSKYQALANRVYRQMIVMCNMIRLAISSKMLKYDNIDVDRFDKYVKKMKDMFSAIDIEKEGSVYKAFLIRFYWSVFKILDPFYAIAFAIHKLHDKDGPSDDTYMKADGTTGLTKAIHQIMTDFNKILTDDADAEATKANVKAIRDQIDNVVTSARESLSQDMIKLPSPIEDTDIKQHVLLGSAKIYRDKGVLKERRALFFYISKDPIVKGVGDEKIFSDICQHFGRIHDTISLYTALSNKAHPTGAVVVNPLDANTRSKVFSDYYNANHAVLEQILKDHNIELTALDYAVTREATEFTKYYYTPTAPDVHSFDKYIRKLRKYLTNNPGNVGTIYKLLMYWVAACDVCRRYNTSEPMTPEQVGKHLKEYEKPEMASLREAAQKRLHDENQLDPSITIPNAYDFTKADAFVDISVDDKFDVGEKAAKHLGFKSLNIMRKYYKKRENIAKSYYMKAKSEEIINKYITNDSVEQGKINNVISNTKQLYATVAPVITSPDIKNMGLVKKATVETMYAAAIDNFASIKNMVESGINRIKNTRDNRHQTKVMIEKYQQLKLLSVGMDKKKFYTTISFGYIEFYYDILDKLVHCFDTLKLDELNKVQYYMYMYYSIAIRRCHKLFKWLLTIREEHKDGPQFGGNILNYRIYINETTGDIQAIFGEFNVIKDILTNYYTNFVDKTQIHLRINDWPDKDYNAALDNENYGDGITTGLGHTCRDIAGSFNPTDTLYKELWKDNKLVFTKQGKKLEEKNNLRVNFDVVEEIEKCNKKLSQAQIDLIQIENQNVFAKKDKIPFNRIYDPIEYPENSVIANYMSIAPNLRIGYGSIMMTYGYSGTGKSMSLFGNENTNGILQAVFDELDTTSKIYMRVYEIYGLGTQYYDYWNGKTSSNEYCGAYINQYVIHHILKKANGELVSEKEIILSDRDDIVRYVATMGSNTAKFTVEEIPNNAARHANYRLSDLAIWNKGGAVPETEDDQLFIEINKNDYENFHKFIKVMDKRRKEGVEIEGSLHSMRYRQINATPNNDESSRSILVYDFQIENNGMFTPFVIYDLPGKEDIEATFIDNPRSKLGPIQSDTENGIKMSVLTNPISLGVNGKYSDVIAEIKGISNTSTSTIKLKQTMEHAIIRDILDFQLKDIPAVDMTAGKTTKKTYSIGDLFTSPPTNLVELFDDAKYNKVVGTDYLSQGFLSAVDKSGDISDIKYQVLYITLYIFIKYGMLDFIIKTTNVIYPQFQISNITQVYEAFYINENIVALLYYLLSNVLNMGQVSIQQQSDNTKDILNRTLGYLNIDKFANTMKANKTTSIMVPYVSIDKSLLNNTTTDKIHNVRANHINDFMKTGNTAYDDIFFGKKSNASRGRYTAKGMPADMTLKRNNFAARHMSLLNYNPNKIFRDGNINCPVNEPGSTDEAKVIDPETGTPTNTTNRSLIHDILEPYEKNVSFYYLFYVVTNSKGGTKALEQVKLLNNTMSFIDNVSPVNRMDQC